MSQLNSTDHSDALNDVQSESTAVENDAIDVIGTASLLDIKVSIEDLNKSYFTEQNLGESVLAHNNKDLVYKGKNIFNGHIFEQRILSTKIREAQKSHLTALELLQVFNGFNADSKASDIWINEHGQCYAMFIRHILLRRLLYNNPFLEFFNSLQISDEEKWQQWMDSFIKLSVREQDIRNDRTFFSQRSLSGLKKNFPEFSSFTKAITLLRSWSFMNSGQQWCYQFLFPFGPDCLFIEVDQKHGKKLNFMSGAGQLAFLMMVRTQEDEIFQTVCQKIHQRFLDPDNMFNRFARDLQDYPFQNMFNTFREGNKQKDHSESAALVDQFNLWARKNDHSMYDEVIVAPSNLLPYKEHRVYSQLLHDCYNVLTLKHELNQRDLCNALGIICNLNLLIYYLETCQKIICFSSNLDECNTDIVVECNHTPGRHIRALAEMRFKANDKLLEQATSSMLTRYVQDMFPKISQTTQFTKDDFNKLTDVLKDSFVFKGNLYDQFTFEHCKKYSFVDESSDAKNTENSTVSFSAICQVLVDYKNSQLEHFLKVHRGFTIDMGLASKFQTRAYRYILTDELVRVLVITTVTKSDQLMLLDDFLESLYQKYHIVIGPKQADRYNVAKNILAQNVEESRLNENLKAFQEQLSRLGFLISLSDTASYIKNPYLE